MDNQKFQNLLQDEKFIEAMESAKTTEEVQKVFKENGLDVSLDEAKAIINDGKKSLEDGSLEKVVGGGFTDAFKKGFKEGFTAPFRGTEIKLHEKFNDIAKQIGYKGSYDEFMKDPKLKKCLENVEDTENGATAGSLALCGCFLLAGAGIATGTTLLVQKLRNKK